jgi:hypothetical protein
MEDLELNSTGNERPAAWERWVFWVVLLLQILPIWMFRYFPSHDGPAHVYNCLILKDIFTSHANPGLTYFMLNPDFPLNVLGHVLLTGLMFVASPLTAEKLLLTIYALTLGLSARYGLSAVRRQSIFLSFLVLPTVFNFTVYMGFYNFIIAIPLFFWVYGYWRRRADSLTWPAVALLAAAFLVMYLAHLFVVVFALLVIGILVIEAVVRSPQLIQFWRVPRFRVAYAALPVVLLAGYFIVEHRSASKYENPLHGLRDLFHDNFIVSFYQGEGAIALLFFGFVAFVTLWQIWKASKRGVNWKADGHLVALAVALVLYVAMPNGMIGGGYTRIRFLLFVVFCDLLWLAQFSYSRRFVRFTQILSIVMALGLAFFHARAYRMLDSYMQEYVIAGNAMTPGKSMLALTYASKGRTAEGGRISRRASPFRHLDSYIGVERGVAIVDNYEAAASLFPLIYRPERNPYPAIVDLYDEPPCADLDAYVATTHNPMDYVLVWFPEAQPEGNVCVERVRNHLQAHYKQIYASPRNLAIVYERKDPQ